ncbi:MAG: sigma 54-interacting transcriptional regulator [Candidatus Brocadiia bacterium]
MQIEDLRIEELLECESDAGLIRFAGEQAIIVDATAMGLLRKELVNQLGITAARVLLTRFGFVQGWRMAETMHARLNGDNDQIWSQACGRIHMLEGMYRLSPNSSGPLSTEGEVLETSYEAEQHIVHLGRSDTCVCWMVCGLTSGYLSRAVGKEIFVLEEKCIGKGDATCHLFGRTVEDWGDERAEELHFFRSEKLNDSLDVLLHNVTESLKTTERALRERRRVLARVEPHIEDPLGMIAKSLAMRKVVELARRIAKVDSTVLITGESGTGKERIAKLIHEESARAQGPFIAVNCGALTETLLESELFGHARGSFTGAERDRPGIFEAANNGTLLLDEIGDISPIMQGKLLRVLQEREVRRVGENVSRPTNARVIAATNRELTKDISEGRFRKDLYYRMNVVELHIPPLRERREDILPLARVLLAEAAIRLNRPMTGLSPRAADQILRYTWPGNVRELENAMERSVVLASVNRTELEDLPEEVRAAIPRASLSGSIRELQDVEKEYILAVLELNNGNQKLTAGQLGIGTATLYRKLKSFGAANGNGQNDDQSK